MEKLSIINDIIKYFFFSLYSLYILKKITNYNELNKDKFITIILACIFIGVIHSMLIHYVSSIFAMSIVLLILTTVTILISKLRVAYTTFITFLSMVINLIFFNISLIIACSPSLLTNNTIYAYSELTRIIVLLITLVIEYILINKFFKINRFKKRFFIYKRY